ncbi:hypothetical protein [Planomonospora venezuelensis]|uniref:hypothetical protein n=1 Tax=Planomonospora venezuelensis TaxID=1999 RepID=UPI00160AC811|nr:hypothetical protein [Planomonospora venezuelensis]GIN00755.1 hypothetical protein Pve01_24130 [Planomonospora venezuelensis]
MDAVLSGHTHNEVAQKFVTNKATGRQRPGNGAAAASAAGDVRGSAPCREMSGVC